MTADWIELRDDAGRYQGRINIRTLTLVLIGRKRQNKIHELSSLIESTTDETLPKKPLYNCTKT